MTINLTELRDEPLGKHPIQAAPCSYWLCRAGGGGICGISVEQDVVASDHESSFTLDVDSLSDDALEPQFGVNALSGAAHLCFGHGGNIYDSPEQGISDVVAIRNPI